MDLEDNVYLPKRKSLYLESVLIRNGGNCLVKIVSNCHVLEELVMINMWWNEYWKRSVSSNTLKRLTLSCMNYDQNPESVSFHTPNLVYLEYSDHVAEKYPKVNLDSLVEANISLQMTDDQCARASYDDLVGNATVFLMGIRNVRFLYLSAYTLKVLTFCCELIPVFNNLICLTIETHGEVGWESLPTLLKKCPNLETLARLSGTRTQM